LCLSLFFAYLIYQNLKVLQLFIFISHFHGNQPGCALFIVDFQGQNVPFKPFKPDFIAPEKPGTSLYKPWISLFPVMERGQEEDFSLSMV